MVFINTTKNWTISNTMLLCLFAVRHILVSLHWWTSKWSLFSFLAIFCVGICWFNYYRRDYSYRDWARREAMLLLLEREEQVTKIKNLHAIRRLFLNLQIYYRVYLTSTETTQTPQSLSCHLTKSWMVPPFWFRGKTLIFRKKGLRSLFIHSVRIYASRYKKRLSDINAIQSVGCSKVQTSI